MRTRLLLIALIVASVDRSNATSVSPTMRNGIEISSLSQVYNHNFESPEVVSFAGSQIAVLFEKNPAEPLSLSNPPNPFITPGKVVPVQQVPDSGSTLALFGASLIGLTALRRKLLN